MPRPDGFCESCGYENAAASAPSSSLPAPAPDALVLVATASWRATVTVGGQPEIRIACEAEANPLLEQAAHGLAALTAAGLLSEPVSSEPVVEGSARVLRWPLPRGTLLSSQIASLEPSGRRRLVLELSRSLSDLATLGTIWPDLSPDLIWKSDVGRPVPLAVWRAFRRSSPPAPTAWTAVCSAPECARGETPTLSSQTHAWARLASLLIPAEDRSGAWSAVLEACLRDEPGKRPGDVSVVVEELTRRPVEPWGRGIRAGGATVEGVSDRGPRRPLQEDRWATHVENDRGVACVADGMGGGSHGGLAAEWVLDEVLAAARQADSLTSVDATRALESASRRIGAFRDALRIEAMGSTATVVAWTRQRVSVAHVGDTRAYRSTAGGPFRLVTHDHVPAGARSGEVLNAVDGRELRVETWEDERAAGGERWLLCSDGYWSSATELGLLPGVPATLNPEQLVREMRVREEEQLRLLELSDNATLVLVHLEPSPPSEVSA
jgi:serine/threonine protein phosphatase PrpC